MTELPKGIGVWGVAVLPIACCLGAPLLVAAGLGVAALALIAGITVGALALAAAIGLLIVRARRRTAVAAPTPSASARRS